MLSTPSSTASHKQAHTPRLLGSPPFPYRPALSGETWRLVPCFRSRPEDWLWSGSRGRSRNTFGRPILCENTAKPSTFYQKSSFQMYGRYLHLIQTLSVFDFDSFLVCLRNSNSVPGLDVPEVVVEAFSLTIEARKELSIASLSDATAILNSRSSIARRPHPETFISLNGTGVAIGDASIRRP